MKALKCIGAAMCLFAAAPAVNADTIANWTFETSVPATAGPHIAELGINAATAEASGFHTDVAVVYSNPSGNGSAESFSSNTWTTVGDYYQFQVSTTGFNTITFGWAQTRSGTGAPTFDLQYRVGTTGVFTTLVAGYSVGTTTWSASTPAAGSVFAPVAAPLADNASIVQFRLVSTAAVSAAGGSNRVDDVIISGVAIGAATGACCNPDGNCTGPVAAGACGGTYQGDNTLCGSVVCPVTQGACCNSVGAGCSVVASAAACASPNSYLGDGSTCGVNAVNCPNGACCATNGSCAVTLSAGCTNPSTWTNGVCDPNSCPQPGACCTTASGACSLITQAACEALIGTVWNGAASCTPSNPCPQPTGACCLANSGACQVLTASACVNGFFGANVTCASIGSCTPSQVVISQVYGGGGNSGAQFNNDFIEVFNRGQTPVDVTGWSVQYASSAGSSWQVTNLPSITLAAGQYLLVQEAAGTGTPGPLPTPDATGTIAMSGTNGKVALSRTTTALTGACVSTAGTVADFVGFGSANCFEGTAATPALSNSTAAIRGVGGVGCLDTNNNNIDFSTGTPTPRNTASPFGSCPPGNPPTGNGSASPAQACAAMAVTFTVTTTSNGTDPVAAVSGNFSAIGLGNNEAFTEGPTNTWTLNVPSLVNATQQLYSFPVTIYDSVGHVGATNIAFTVISCNSTLSNASGDPDFVCNGSATHLTVTATPGPMSSHAGLDVFADLSSVSASAPNPAHFTRVGATDVYEYFVTVDAAIPIGPKTFVVNLTDATVAADTRNLTITTAPCTNSASQIVISQVFGGGGNSGAIWKNDFVELFNRSSVAVSLNGWSLQYGSDTDAGFSGSIGSGANSNSPVPLSGTIQPGKYFLIELGEGANTGAAPLPTPDLVGVPAIPLSSSAGRLALVRNSVAPLGTTAGGACADSNIEDFVGYGATAECFEGDSNLGPTATINNSTAVFRRLGGCQDTDRNAFDFYTGEPAPRNGATPANNCGGPVVNGVCCRGATCSTAFATAQDCANANDSTNPGTILSAYHPASTACNTPVTTPGMLGNTTSPCCYANYNHNASLEVQDIFDFLNDWFAGKKGALVGGDGTTGTLQVQNIFDFLNAWFAGGCV
ncbi:MAG TPA: lamin tail domain-containing protein [Phycisphaerales bacterium]|nr:lamin tail domain-containing protein [Phycisphaerales bacterium]